jgi:hypothetical protein
MSNAVDERLFGRHEYTRSFRIGATTMLVSPFVWATVFFFAEGDFSLISIPLLVLGLSFVPLVIRYNTFALTLANDEIHIESWKNRKIFSIEDIVELRTREVSTRESTYVRVRQGAKFSFEHGLQNYEFIKECLLERSLLSRREEDQRKAKGTHRYRKTYLVWLSLAIFTLAFVIAQMLPETDLGSRFVVGMLILFGTPLVVLFIRDLAFQLEIDEEGVRAKRFSSRNAILFTDVEKIEGDSWGMTLADSSRRKISFSRFLDNYEHIREYLFRACQAGKVTPLEDLLE